MRRRLLLRVLGFLELKWEKRIGLDELNQLLGIPLIDEVIEGLKARGRMRLASAARKVVENKP